MTVRKYRVRQGYTYGANAQYGPGAIVELEEDVAVHNLDKLELAEVIQNVPAPQTSFQPEDFQPEDSDGSPEKDEEQEGLQGVEKPARRATTRSSRRSGG